ncbi:hypothetical protein P8452_75650 [Trifolium repens]|nr:hypothetical protein P8452_75650 [Trifolium repens]
MIDCSCSEGEEDLKENLGEEGCICSTEQEEEVDSAENSFKKIRCRPSFFAELNEVLTRELAEDGYSW